MNIILHRHTFTEKSTIGDLIIDGKPFCHTLEDYDRGLTSDMSLEQIKEIKVKSLTAIPTGRYEVVKYFSPKHQANVPLLMDVPGFDGVEIHVGNTSIDTDGCILLGYGIATDMITQSKAATTDFYKLFFAAADKVWLTVMK